MRLKVLSIFEFDEFAKNHPLGTFTQSSSYGMLMSERGYDYELIGMVDENDTIVAASLILVKKIGLFSKYGYAPKGFLIDYSNIELLKKFVSLLRNRYYKKNFVFIKINPEISIAEINKKGKEVSYEEAKVIEDSLISIGFKTNNKPTIKSIATIKNDIFSNLLNLSTILFIHNHLLY